MNAGGGVIVLISVIIGCGVSDENEGVVLPSWGVADIGVQLTYKKMKINIHNEPLNSIFAFIAKLLLIII